MKLKEVLRSIQEDYYHISGLRSYIVDSKTSINSASERNYFCKCLKTSSKALEKCVACTIENYEQAIAAGHENIYCCHAGLMKWAMPIYHKDTCICVLMVEGILSGKQMEERDAWSSYLAKTYGVSHDIMEQTLKVIKVMDEDKVNASIELLKHLIQYHFSFYQEEDTTQIAA